MPNVNCCVPYCCADSKRHGGLRFYTLPKDKEHRQAWILLIRNTNLRITSRYTSVCSLHFPGGSKTYDTKDPSIFPWSPQWPAIIQEYNNRQQLYQNNNGLLDTNSKKNRPMTLRIPPMCPWADQYNDINSNKNIHDFYSPKTLQVDHELQEITTNSNWTTNDFFRTIEAQCEKIKTEPVEPTTSADESKPDLSSLIDDKTNLSLNMNNKNANSSLDFCSPSPLSSELLLQTPVNNNDLHSSLFSYSPTENQITHELAQAEAEIHRRTLLMNDHYNRKVRREVQKDVLASNIYPNTFPMTSPQTNPTEDLHPNLQIQTKKNLATGWDYWSDLEYNFSNY